MGLSPIQATRGSGMSTPTSDAFDVTAIDDASFEGFYRARIAPWLSENEARRVAVVSSFRRNAALSVGVALLGALVVWQIWAAPEAGAFVGLVIGVLGAGLAYQPVSQLQDQVKLEMVSTLAHAIGVSFSHEVTDPPAFKRLRSLSLVPSFDRSKFEDCFSGERFGCRFELYEAHLEDERRDKDGDRSYVTVFRGQLIKIAFPKAFHGVTIVRRDAGILNAMRAWGSEFKRVGLLDSRFERAFEVYSNDQVEARYLVHPVFMERLLELETIFKGKAVRCAFEAGDLLVAVEGGDKFEAGSMFKPLGDPERARKLISEISHVFKLIDAVLTAEQAPLTAHRLNQERGGADSA